MGYMGARGDFKNAKSNTTDEAMRLLADGLTQLSRAIESDLEEIKRKLQTIQSQMR